MDNKKTFLIIIIIIISSFLFSFIVFDKVPEAIPTHWNIEGKVDGYSQKEIGLFLLPILTIITTMIFFVIPRIDPNKKNIELFQNHYNFFLINFTIFITYLHLLTILFALNAINNILFWLTPSFTILFLELGILLEKTKQNYSIGFRTPWTLANKQVWQQTHEKMAKLTKISAIITLIGMIFPTKEIFFIITPIITTTIIGFIYSYYLFKKIEDKK